jgi:uncharacterized membrane protein YdjX (TVP38/TMEM64 family)
VRESGLKLENNPQSETIGWARFFLCAALLLLLIIAMWRWIPGELLTDLERSDLARGLLAPLITIGVFTLASVVLVPVTFLITATAFMFDPLPSILYSLSGSFVAGIVTFLLGRLLGQQMLNKLLGSRWNELTHRLAEEGFVAVAAARILPLGPFTIVNMVAGSTRIRFSDFAIGTLIGMLPGTLAICLFADRIRSIVRQPTWQAIVVLLLIAVGFGVLLMLVRHWIQRRD